MRKGNAGREMREGKCGKGNAGTSMISKSQEETEVSVRLEEWGLEAGVGRISWRTACDPG